jgi:signal transduction histidine kinase
MRRSGFVHVSAADVARQAVDFYLPAAELKGIALSYRGNGPADISGDPVLLAQAIGNLIDNALKYTTDGGLISVEVQTVADGKVWITVADDGPGIPDEEKPKVSTRFYRGDASRGTPGVGLGLTLVASVAKVHGGALELADNNPGLRAHMVIPVQSPGAADVLHSALTGPAAAAAEPLTEPPAGATEATATATAAQSLRIRSVS